jgi:hypothetical protein
MMSGKSIHLSPTPDDSDASKTPSGIEGLEEKESSDHVADEVDRASWTDGAGSRPRPRYSYNVIET